MCYSDPAVRKTDEKFNKFVVVVVGSPRRRRVGPRRSGNTGRRQGRSLDGPVRPRRHLHNALGLEYWSWNLIN